VKFAGDQAAEAEISLWAAVWLHRASGPLIVVTATGVFLLSLARKPI
jgi:hypothetical protein